MIRQIYHIIKKIYLSIIQNCNVDPRIIVFCSQPDYSDNSRALSDYLLNNDYLSKYKIYWIVGDALKFQRKYSCPGISFIQSSGLSWFRYIYICHIAKWHFSTHSIVYYNENQIKKGQTIIRLWHGCSFKGKDATMVNNYCPQFNKALVAGPFFINTKAIFWNCDINRLIAKGYPRYDWLIHQSDLALSVFNKLKADNSHVIMWMPTFRNDKHRIYNDTDNIKAFPLIKSNNDLLKINAFCIENNTLLLIKLHQYQQKYAIEQQIMSNVRFIDDAYFEQEGIQLYSFLAITDGLISDYSSVAVDYLLVNKPLAYTLDDYELYCQGRGFIVENPLAFMPGHHLYNVHDLCRFIQDVSQNNDQFIDKRKQVADSLLYHSENYCKDIIQEFGL